MSLATEKLGPPQKFKSYTSIDQNIDLIAEGGSTSSQIIVVGNGTLVVEDASGEVVALPDFGGPAVWVLGAKKIVSSGTTASNIVVAW